MKLELAAFVALLLSIQTAGAQNAGPATDGATASQGSTTPTAPGAPLAAATGTVTGSIHDQKTGEDLVGASVLLVGTKLGASADLEGKFTIRAVPAGTYELRITYVGYAPKVVQGVKVQAGQAVQFDVVLGAEAEEKAKEEVVVSAQRVLATEAAVLAERQKSATIGDAVSAEQIRRSPDATSGDALKRVTGVSIVDNKFVFVRGVTDRYNVTALNGVSVTSTDTDVDRKSFSFDLVPANLLENTVVVKTATPDLPGDFSGGLVQVNTLDFPAARTARLQLTTGFDGATTTKSMMVAQGGGHDWLGKDDGTRALPAGGLTGSPLAQQLPNNWALQPAKAPFGFAGNFSFGDRRAVGADDELGFVGALSYLNRYQTSSFTQRPTNQGVPIFDFSGDRYEQAILWGGLLNLNYKLNGRHKFSWKSNYSQSAAEKVNVAAGLPESGQFTQKQTTEWDERSLYLTQVGGEHKLDALHGLRAEWKGFYSKSKAEEPDRKEAEFEEVPGGFALRTNYRTWSALDENSHGASADFTVPAGETKLKTGALLERRERSFGIDAYSTDASRLDPANYGLVVLPVDKVFAGENYGQGKFRFIPVSTFTGAYDGDYRLNAGYGMVDRPQMLFGRRFRLVGGVRVEDATMNVKTVPEIGAPPVITSLAHTDPLPSANLAWIARENVNVRLAYGRAVNRPEMRELSDVLYYDFDHEQNVRGNPDLDRALVDNYDVRVEFFPHVGEVLAASYFYKKFDNAIEERLIASPERFVRTWFNSPSGKNYGVELECRKTLGFLGAALNNISVTGNYTRIKSAIEYTDARTDGSGAVTSRQLERVMQGQSPWSFNTSLLYVVPRYKTTLNILYGKVGRRLDAVGDSREQDVYEESRDLLELAVTKNFRSRWEAKFSARNLLREDEVLTTGSERSMFAKISRDQVWAISLSRAL